MPSNPVPKKNPDLWTAEYYEPLPSRVKEYSLGNPQTFNVISIAPTDNASHPIYQSVSLVPDKIYIQPSGGVGYIGPPMGAVYPIPNMSSQLIEKTDLNQIWYQNCSGIVLFILYYGAPSINVEIPELRKETAEAIVKTLEDKNGV